MYVDEDYPLVRKKWMKQERTAVISFIICYAQESLFRGVQPSDFPGPHIEYTHMIADGLRA